MAEENQSQNNNDAGAGEASNAAENQQNQSSTPPDLDKLVSDRVAEALKDVKGKLDNAYAQRDEALKVKAEYERKEREAEIAKLKEEGNLKEAHEKEMSEERAKREAAEKKIVELTRDNSVRALLGSLDFRTPAATEMAYKEIVGGLIQNEQGDWVHKSGVALSEFVEKFATDENNSFLFKPKVSSGAGTGANTGGGTPPSGGEKKSLFNMSQAEVLKLAAEGKL